MNMGHAGRGKTTKEKDKGAPMEEAARVQPWTPINPPPTESRGGSGIGVSMFDSSVENHFVAIDRIADLCGVPPGDAFDESDIARFSSSITFLREWMHFNYKPRPIRFSCETSNPRSQNVGVINLPQFSAATVPKDSLPGDMHPGSSNDFVLYVGGSIWALDWCPRVHRSYDHHINCEFLAVAAHPPESSYHKIGAPLTGRGMIQIWSLLNLAKKEGELTPPKKTKRGRHKSTSITKEKGKETEPKGPRGRPRKYPPKEKSTDMVPELKRPRGRPRRRPSNETDMVPEPERPKRRPRRKPSNENDVVPEPKRPRRRPSNENDMVPEPQFVQALIEFPKDSSVLNGVSLDPIKHATQKDDSKKWKGLSLGVSACDSSLKTYKRRRGLKTKEKEEMSASESTIPKDLVLPRVVLCLAHNGKVAWDVKWQPLNLDTERRSRMGYLAVLLGNGSLEVWEVPSPQMMKHLYSPHIKGTDPRFVKLDPVFKCSKLKCGAGQSIPLTLEWSASYPHDLILAGCHDGTVALWKFFAGDSSKDTRPLLCFKADTAPIRALAWAPDENDPESKNIIVTGGSGGIKFWDIRDPYRPLWDLVPTRKVINSLDWLPDPRCVILSYDDGTLRILSLARAACDVPVTGKPFVGTQQLGLATYYCSVFSIWSVQASRQTGMVAYSSSDGSALCFRLTTKAVEKDPYRNRAPHFLCGSLTEDESVTLTVNTPLPDTPFPMKKSHNEWADTPRTIRGFLQEANRTKRARDHKADAQNPDNILALCYGDDVGNELGPDNALAFPSSKSSKKKPKETQALASKNEEPNVHDGIEIDVLPPKAVAMHKVRWNMNKGSGRWLCFGGAGGIIRCQEVPMCNAK